MSAEAKHKVIIVGAGPGGLASSLLLAQSGIDVTIIEKEEMVGGRTHVWEKDGYKFDNGPTFFHFPEVIEEIFQAIGRDAHQDLGLIPIDPNYRLVFGAGGSIDATCDLDLMTERIREISGDENAEGFRRYIEDNRKKLSRSRVTLQTPWNSITNVFSRRALSAATVLRPWKSVASDLEQKFPDPRIRLAMSFQTKYLGMSPFHAPSLFTILSYLEYAHGVFHAEGGLGQISERMANIAREMGVEIRLGEKVEEMIFESEKSRTITGVRTSQGVYNADKVVVNADFATAMKGLVPDSKRKKWSNKKLDKKGYSCSTFMLYLGVDKLYADQPHHQIYAAEDYETNLDAIVNGDVPWQDPSIYVQNASVTDSTMAPDGHSTLYVLVPVPNMKHDIDWDSIKYEYRDAILKQMEKLGFKDVEKHIKSETIVTPKDWGERSIYRGAVFNLAHNIPQMLWMRPNNRFEEFDNVYIVGGGTHPGSGLPTIYESGRISSKLICADLGIVPDWNGVETWFPQMRLPKALRKKKRISGSQINAPPQGTPS